MSEKIPLKEVLVAVDLKAKNLWDDIDDDQRKALKSELWILNRYISSAKTNNAEAQRHFVLMVNECFNKHWFTLQKHPKLLWQLLCICSFDGEKTFFHEWIGTNKKKGGGKRESLLREVYPNMKNDDIETLLEINSDVDFRNLAREMGWSEKDVKNL
jgi:hypothetical protein